MRKQILIALILALSLVSLGASRVEAIGIIYEEDFRTVGVKEENIDKARDIVLDANKAHQLLMLERQQLELEVNKYLLEGPEENWEKISDVFDKLGNIEAQLMKNKLKSQLEVRKYISESQYQRAREEAAKRIESTGVKVKVRISETSEINDKK